MFLVFFLLFIVVLIILLTLSTTLLVEKWKALKELRSKYDPLLEPEQILSNINAQIIEAQKLQRNEKERLDELLATLENEITILTEHRDNLQAKIKPLEETAFLYDNGFYEAQYTHLDTPVKLERELSLNRELQKKLIAKGNAVYGGSGKEGKAVTKLVLRAFNGECDYFVSKVDYKNVVTYEERVKRLFAQLNKATTIFEVIINEEFMELKINELQLVHEYHERKQQEAEEQRQLKEIMREEIQAERELEKAREDAEKEERTYQFALDKLMAELSSVSAEQQVLLQSKIAGLEAQLKEAQERKERAISQAQLTRSGHVYIISNIGSFGENVFKIGMTRRLEPTDRVKELGDASVPFSFDIHAMIYSTDAPSLENNLHREFEKYRVNMVNGRKEFFQVDFDEIEQAVKSFNADIKLTKLAEAKEYRQSELARRNIYQ